MPNRILKFLVKELFILQLCSFFRSRLLENHVSIARPGKTIGEYGANIVLLTCLHFFVVCS